MGHVWPVEGSLFDQTNIFLEAHAVIGTALHKAKEGLEQ